MAVPSSWMPSAKMERIIFHWTAGAHKASALDREHYHILVEADGHLVQGDRSIKDNEGPITGDYAAHTLNCNTGSIGVAVCCMMVLGSIAGYLLTGGVPAPVSAALVFTTPLYFILSLVISARARIDTAAIVLGCGLCPLLYLVVPGFDLLATGLIGGTLAYVWGARAR